jgi:peptidase E
MTKYILHGGTGKGTRGGKDDLYREMLKDAPHEVRVLLVYFAKELDRIAINQEEDTEGFTKEKGDKVLTFEVANEEHFVEQAKQADVIYLHGGSTPKLLSALKKFPGLKELFEGKTIAGDSAGANVLASFSFSVSGDGVLVGLGIVPIRLLCHYFQERAHSLDDVAPELELVRLREYEQQVFNM